MIRILRNADRSVESIRKPSVPKSFVGFLIGVFVFVFGALSIHEALK